MARIRQTKTDWQKAMESHPGEIQWVSWSDKLPEVLHVSITLIDNDYNSVKADFFRIADYVNKKHQLPQKFFFNLTYTIKLIKQDRTILDEINQTIFKNAFDILLLTYKPLFSVDITHNEEMSYMPLFRGYEQILDGRSDISILCKYIMMQYENLERPDHSGLFSFNKTEEILSPQNVSMIMASFPVSIGLSENIDKIMCHYIWLFNYIEMPHIPAEDDSVEEARKFNEANLDKSVNEFKGLFNEFKTLNMLVLYPKPIAEINMGFASRVCNLAVDIVDLVKSHKGEIAELTFRSFLESFIIGSWLLKRNDPILYQRYREYTTGREKFMGEKIIKKISDETWKSRVKEHIEDAIKESGKREINIASERGDIFDSRIDQMADEIWGKDNIYYNSYKRSSEITHGNWRAITKYHLSKSLNPMQNGLYWYNENCNRFAGMVPAFTSLGLASEFLVGFIKEVQSEDVKGLMGKIEKFRADNAKGWMEYFNRYILKYN